MCIYYKCIAMRFVNQTYINYEDIVGEYYNAVFG